jgi:hypothetical protein
MRLNDAKEFARSEFATSKIIRGLTNTTKGLECYLFLISIDSLQ